MVMNSGTSQPHPLRNNLNHISASKPDGVPTTTPPVSSHASSHPPAETVPARTQNPPPVSANNPAQHVVNNNAVRTRSGVARALAHKNSTPRNNSVGAPRNNPGSAVPIQFLPPTRDLTALNNDRQADGPMIIRAITSYATVCPPTSHQFQSVGDFSYQRSSTLASLDKKDLDNIKACRRNLGQSFDLHQLLTARQCPIQSEIHLYILTVCIQDAIEAVLKKEKTVDNETADMMNKYRDRTREQSLTIYQLLNLLFNLIYTSEFEPVPTVIGWIEKITDVQNHDSIRVMHLIEECFNLLQNDQLVSFRYFLHDSFRSLVTFENVMDKRLPQMNIEDVSDKIIKLQEQGFCSKPPREPELPDLQKFGVTGEFFLIRQYVAKCREAHPREKFTKESVTRIIAQKMAARGSSGGMPPGVSTAGPSRTRHAVPTPPAMTRTPTTTTRTNPPVTRQLSHPPRQPTSQLQVSSQSSPNMYTSPPPTYATLLPTNQAPQHNIPQNNPPHLQNNPPYSHPITAHPQPGQRPPYVFQSITTERIALVTPNVRKEIVELMGRFDKLHKDIATVPMNHPHRQAMASRLKLMANELTRYDQELTRVWQARQQAAQMQRNSVPQQQQQQQQTQQQHQIPTAVPQQTVNWQPMPPNSMAQSGPPTGPPLIMPNRNNLVMDQQRRQQLQQLIKDTPQFNAIHQQPPNNPQLLSHNPVNVAYPPPQLSTVPVSNHSGGVPLMNSQAVPQYQQQIVPQMAPQQQQLPPQQQQLPPQQQQLPPQLIPQPPASQAQQVPPKQTRPGPGRPRKKSSPKQTPVNIQAHSASNPSTTNPNIIPPAVNDQQQHAIAVDPRTEKKPFTVQEPGKKERMEWMTQAEADELQSKLLEEYNKKKAEEQKKAEELRKKAEEQKKLEEQKKAQIGPSQSPNAQGKKIPVISDERTKKKVVVIQVDSDDDHLAASSSTAAVPADSKKPIANQPESSSASCTTPTIPTSVTSDNHVTSTTQSPGNRTVTPAHSEENDERLLSGELPANRMSYVTLIAELCNFENRNDKAIKEANERKRKAEEECERLNNKAARIKKRRQELLKLCLEDQKAADSDSELSIIDHTTVATPSSETLRINRSRIGPFSEKVKNIIGDQDTT